VLIDPIWWGSIAVLVVSALMVLRPMPFFSRKLSLEEALSVCWVAWAVYMAAFVVYIGLKPLLGLSRNTHAAAVGLATFLSVGVILLLARATTDWRRAVTKSIFGLMTLTLVVAGAVLFFH
jgi:hypothetical protein